VEGHGDRDKQTLMHEFQQAAEQGYSALPPLNPADYKQYVEGFDLTEEQTNELLHTLWQIMSAFVDLGWGVDSLQNVLPGLAEFSANCEIQEIEDNTTDDFNGASGNDANDAPEGDGPP